MVEEIQVYCGMHLMVTKTSIGLHSVFQTDSCALNPHQLTSPRLPKHIFILLNLGPNDSYSEHAIKDRPDAILQVKPDSRGAITYSQRCYKMNTMQ